MKYRRFAFFTWMFLFCSVFLHAGEIPSGRAFFVSVIEEPPVLGSRGKIAALVEYAKKTHTKTLFVQVYRSNQAWFPSKLADKGPYETCLKSVGEDPLSLLIREAHSSGIEVHAWMNLLSLGANSEAPLLKKYGAAILTRNIKKKHSLKDYKIDDQFFLEPGDPRVQEALSVITGELVTRYPGLDGLQFDYIRYPDWHPRYGHTRINIERYRKKTGRRQIREESKEWQDWKRAQVTELLAKLAHKARMIHPAMQISTTGLMPYSRAFEEGSQDWRSWIQSGLIDFVTLMCYAKDEEGFKKYLEDSEKNLSGLKKANIAVGAYSQLHTPKVFGEQFKLCEDAHPRGCVVLHYGNLLEEPVLADVLGSFSDMTGQ